MSYASTLFQINPIAPKWVGHIVHLLSTNTFPTSMNKVRQRYLQKQAHEFCLIANQLYHRGKDAQL